MKRQEPGVRIPDKHIAFRTSFERETWPLDLSICFNSPGVTRKTTRSVIGSSLFGLPAFDLIFIAGKVANPVPLGHKFALPLPMSVNQSKIMKHKNRFYKIDRSGTIFTAQWNGYSADGLSIEQACEQCHRMIEEDCAE